MATIIRYNKDFLADLTTLDRKKLYLIKKENENMFNYIIVGYVNRHYKSIGREIPFEALRKDLNKKSGCPTKMGIDEIETFLKSSSIYKRLDADLVIDGYNKCLTFGLSADELIVVINSSDKLIRLINSNIKNTSKEFGIEVETLLSLLPQEYKLALKS